MSTPLQHLDFIAFFAIVICLKKLPLLERHTGTIGTERLRDSVGGAYLVCGYVVVPFKRDGQPTLFFVVKREKMAAELMFNH